MKVLLVFLVFLSFLSCNVNNEIVQIPDDNFKAYLIDNEEINTNGDNYIQVNEARAFTSRISLQYLKLKI